MSTPQTILCLKCECEKVMPILEWNARSTAPNNCNDSQLQDLRLLGHLVPWINPLLKNKWLFVSQMVDPLHHITVRITNCMTWETEQFISLGMWLHEINTIVSGCIWEMQNPWWHTIFSVCPIAFDWQFIEIILQSITVQWLTFITCNKWTFP